MKGSLRAGNLLSGLVYETCLHFTAKIAPCLPTYFILSFSMYFLPRLMDKVIWLTPAGISLICKLDSIYITLKYLAVDVSCVLLLACWIRRAFSSFDCVCKKMLSPWHFLPTCKPLKIHWVSVLWWCWIEEPSYRTMLLSKTRWIENPGSCVLD